MPDQGIFLGIGFFLYFAVTGLAEHAVPYEEWLARQRVVFFVMTRMSPSFRAEAVQARRHVSERDPLALDAKRDLDPAPVPTEEAGLRDRGKGERDRQR
jgi:hypothetical protein